MSEECCRWYGVDNPDMAFRIVISPWRVVYLFIPVSAQEFL